MSPSNTETAADLLSAFLAKAKYSSASDSFPASRKARATATTNSGFFLFFPFNNCPRPPGCKTDITETAARWLAENQSAPFARKKKRLPETQNPGSAKHRSRTSQTFSRAFSSTAALTAGKDHVPVFLPWPGVAFSAPGSPFSCQYNRPVRGRKSDGCTVSFRWAFL